MDFYWFLNNVKTQEMYKFLLPLSRPGTVFDAKSAAPKLADCLLREFDDYVSLTKTVGERVTKSKKILSGTGDNAKKNLSLAEKATSVLMLNEIEKATEICADVYIGYEREKPQAFLNKNDCATLVQKTFLGLGRGGGGSSMKCLAQGVYEHSDNRPPHVQIGFAKLSDFEHTMSAEDKSVGVGLTSIYYYKLKRNNYISCLNDWIKSGKANHKQGDLYKMLAALGDCFNGKPPYDKEQYAELAKYLGCEKKLRKARDIGYVVPNRDKTFDVDYSVVIAPAMKAITSYVEVMKDIINIETTGATRAAETAQRVNAEKNANLDKRLGKNSIFNDTKERAYSDAEIAAQQAGRQAGTEYGYNVADIQNRGYVHKDPYKKSW